MLGQVSAGNPKGLAHVRLRMVNKTVSLYGGAQTQVSCFEATLLKGKPNTVGRFSWTWPGPIIRVDKGTRFRADIFNDLNEESIIHFHGVHVPELEDGHPLYVKQPGETYSSEFTVVNRAGTYWFHPHPDMLTGKQVYAGMAGLFIVSDPEEQALSLPRGEYDLPILIQDRRYDTNNQLVYNNSSMAGMLGNKMCVNGYPDYVHSCATRVYRLRIVNGSNARIYKLAWGDGSPMVVIGTDGGLLAAPIQKPYVTLAPGERVEVWADFRQMSLGSDAVLLSQSFTGVGPAGGQSPIQGSLFEVMRFRIARIEDEVLTLPQVLSNPSFENPNEAINKDAPRHFPVTMFEGKWVLNGQPFQLEGIMSNEQVRLGTLEVWEFSNILGMSPIAHPIHIHCAQFQVIQRSPDPARQVQYDTLKSGFTDEGWKDTFLLMPGEVVKVLVRFSKYKGQFLYHCHNLEHEDMGMMRNFIIY